MVLSCQAPTVLTKRGLSSVVGASLGALHLATAFPRPVWLDHLLPLLKLQEAVILRATCKAMRAIVADMRADICGLSVKELKAMLTCFPKAATVELYEEDDEDEEEYMTTTEQDRLVAWLVKRGNSLTRIDRQWDTRGPFVRRAWQAGVFKTVRSVSLDFSEEFDRNLIIEGLVSGVESISITISQERHVERAALGYLRHFPALKDITCSLVGEEIGLPPFIPPSLEALSLDSHFGKAVLVLRCLPPMIESSGAKLRRLELGFDTLSHRDTARGVRSLLQACAATLTEVTLSASKSLASAVEVVEGLASCPHLECLTTPISTFAVLPPGGGIAFRLARLRLNYCYGDTRAEGDRLSLSDLALWGVMARGGFPTLSSLSLMPHGWRWGAELGPAVVAAFESRARSRS
jgi:hypothetical protein